MVIWVGHSIDYKINPISRPIAGAVGEEIIFMDDDDQPHFKRVYLGSVTIQLIHLPDLNPIEKA